MEVNEQRLKEAFPAVDSQDEAVFEYDEVIGSYSGYLIRDEYRDLPISERQKRIWETLRQTFGEDSTNISLILGFSPSEWHEIREEVATTK